MGLCTPGKQIETKQTIENKNESISFIIRQKNKLARLLGYVSKKYLANEQLKRLEKEKKIFQCRY